MNEQDMMQTETVKQVEEVPNESPFGRDPRFYSTLNVARAP
jgi:hypothetical protein